MRPLIRLAALLVSLVSVNAFADGGVCKLADTSKWKDHLEKHVTYPATGKAIKAQCRKEFPDEFTPAERACCNKQVKDAVEYKSAAEVEKLLGI
jgi:hypothetical protein